MSFAHPRFPSQAEKPDADKLSHSKVDYVAQSNKSEHCATCHHFVQSSPPRCVGVQSPINPAGWCKRWEGK